MPESRNMGRKSRLGTDMELKQAQAGLADDLPTRAQPTRPTMHPQQPTKSAGDEPMRRHSRRGE